MGRAGLFEIIAEFLHWVLPESTTGDGLLRAACPWSSMGLPGMFGSDPVMALSCPSHFSHTGTQFCLEKSISYFSTDGSL